jgi:RNA polymerase sigma-19 factor, ECF subfamily
MASMSARPYPSPAPSHVAARRIYGEHHPWLLQRLHARLQHRQDAEDLTAETFVQLLAQPDLGSIREPRAFLTTLARRLLFHFWRRRDLEQAYLQAVRQIADTHAIAADEQAMLTEALVQIDRALDGLSATGRKAFLLSQLDGLTYAQIAARLNISVMTVRRYVARGIACCCAANP